MFWICQVRCFNCCANRGCVHRSIRCSYLNLKIRSNILCTYKIHTFFCFQRFLRCIFCIHCNIACDRIFYRSEFCTIFVIIPADKNVVLSIRCRQAANQGSFLYFTGLQFTSTFCIECNLILFLCFIVFVILSCDDIYDLIPKIRFFRFLIILCCFIRIRGTFLVCSFFGSIFCGIRCAVV